VKITDTSDLWWKTAVVYCLDVQTFLDWNGDGRGDLVGLTQRLDYLHDLGVTCLWLMPIYPSPDRDDGYDISDFYGVDPRIGTHGDFVEFIRTARDRGMRVILDLVVNHTSDQHPWFKAARASRESPYRDWYVWSDEPVDDKPSMVAFPDAEKSIWEYDEKSGQYYLHRFYKFQPDLNTNNPQVRDEVAKIIGFWLQLGVNGFRVDAVPYFIEQLGEPAENGAARDPHQYLKDVRGFLDRRVGDAMLLGEVNVPRELQRDFFGDNGRDDELHMCFDFLSMQHLYLSLARADARPLVDALLTRPEIPRTAQWATFVRNHDELTLDQLSEDERQEVFAAFGPEPDMQLYGHGLRRRLPTMLGGDPRRLRMVYSLLFSLPGTPVLFYGEEIGMGENLAIPGRMAVRTPMQWTDDVNGGFSPASGRKLVRPVVDGAYGPAFVNVSAQRHDDDSLLTFVQLLIRRYRECPELGWGEFEVLDQPHASVLAHRCSWDDGQLVAVHNLSGEAVSVPLRLADCDERTRLVDLLCDGSTSLDEKGQAAVALEPYGFRWLRVSRPGDRRLV
jgi:trehalose synthase